MGEESQKLEQIISNKLTQRKIEATEERATELLVEFNKLKIQQEAELYSLIKKHREAMTEETKMKELMERNLLIKETEIKKQRSHYGDKMKDMRSKLDEAIIDKAAIIRDLADSENIKRISNQGWYARKR